MVICQSNCIHKKNSVCVKSSVKMSTIQIQNQIAVICTNFEVKK